MLSRGLLRRSAGRSLLDHTKNYHTAPAKICDGPEETMTRHARYFQVTVKVTAVPRSSLREPESFACGPSGADGTPTSVTQRRIRTLNRLLSSLHDLQQGFDPARAIDEAACTRQNGGKTCFACFSLPACSSRYVSHDE